MTPSGYRRALRGCCGRSTGSDRARREASRLHLNVSGTSRRSAIRASRGDVCCDHVDAWRGLSSAYALGQLHGEPRDLRSRGWSCRVSPNDLTGNEPAPQWTWVPRCSWLRERRCAFSRWTSPSERWFSNCAGHGPLNVLVEGRDATSVRFGSAVRARCRALGLRVPQSPRRGAGFFRSSLHQPSRPSGRSCFIKLSAGPPRTSPRRTGTLSVQTSRSQLLSLQRLTRETATPQVIRLP